MTAQIRAARRLSLQHPVLYTLLWIVLILAVFVPLSVRQYERAASR